KGSLKDWHVAPVTERRSAGPKSPTVSTTWAAAAGPALVTVAVKVTSSPRWTSPGNAVSVVARSALWPASAMGAVALGLSLGGSPGRVSAPITVRVVGGALQAAASSATSVAKASVRIMGASRVMPRPAAAGDEGEYAGCSHPRYTIAITIMMNYCAPGGRARN